MGVGDPRVGSTLGGKYLLKRLIGTGSMGAVYEGAHVEIGKRVAVKLMSQADVPEVVARFRREARAASAVESDYVVQIFDFGQDPQHGMYMVIEFLEGEDLEARLGRGHLDANTVATIGFQAARGLAKAHAAGVIHRDLKPANIFLTTRDDGSLLTKVLDFGISKVHDGAITAVGLTVGTPQYMSPEQVGAARDLDGRTDVWSLAAVLYEALSGRPAIPDQNTPYDVMMFILKGTITPLREIAPWVPQAVADVVHGGLVRDRNRRIADAALFAQHLLSACPDAGGSGRFSLVDLARYVPLPPEEDEPISEIPVSIAFDPGSLRPEPMRSFEAARPVEPLEPPSDDEEPAPQTMRDPAMVLRMDQVATPPTMPPERQGIPSTIPPGSEAEGVEYFERLPSEVMTVAGKIPAAPSRRKRQ